MYFFHLNFARYILWTSGWGSLTPGIHPTTKSRIRLYTSDKDYGFYVDASRSNKVKIVFPVALDLDRSRTTRRRWEAVGLSHLRIYRDGRRSFESLFLVSRSCSDSSVAFVARCRCPGDVGRTAAAADGFYSTSLEMNAVF